MSSFLKLGQVKTFKHKFFKRWVIYHKNELMNFSQQELILDALSITIYDAPTKPGT